MKRALGFFIVSLYIWQILLITWIFLSMNLRFISFDVDILLWISLIMGVVAFFLGLLNVFLGLRKIFNSPKCVYKSVMISKILLIPFFIINFFLCFIIVIILFNPFMFFVVPFILYLMICGAFGIVLATSSYNIGYMLNKIRNKEKTWNDLIVYFLLQFIFILDIVSSILLFKKEAENNSNDNNM